ncbi:MAG: hypothetical protein ACI3XH_01270, partial [Phascolarctobacterium sp.]
MLFSSTILHFFVDGTCGAALSLLALNGLETVEIVSASLQYNLWAFGTQWIIGLVSDKWSLLSRKLLVLAMLMLIAGSCLNVDWRWLVVALGLGNSIFHVVAGKLILERYTGYKEPGVFVSSGALGLALGTQGIISLYLMLAGVFASTFFLYRMVDTDNEVKTYKVDTNMGMRSSHQKSTLLIGMSVLAISACVIIRGFSGSVQFAGMPLLLPCIYMLGKAIGGICCDKLGYKNMVLFLMIASFAVLQFTGLIPMLAFVLLCNMAMPLTLKMMHNYLPRQAGFVFGLAAGCLIPGWYFK